MDFADERYVRIFIRDTTTWKRLGWEGQCTLIQLLRKVDRAGVLELDDMDPASAASLHTGGPIDFVSKGVERILALGVAEHREGCLVFPRFLEAQETAKTDKQRQRESREKRRDTAKSRSRESQNVTDCHAGHDTGHAVTESVTPCRAVPCLSEPQPNQKEERESARVREPTVPFRIPVGEPPQDLKPEPEPEPPPSLEGRVWKAFGRARGVDPIMLGAIDWRACQALTGPIKASAGGSEGVEFDEAADVLLRAWMRDPWVAEKRPRLQHLAKDPSKYLGARPELKPIKLVTTAYQEWKEPAWMREGERAEAANGGAR